MNADELITALQSLSPNQRRLPLIGADGFGADGEISSLHVADLVDGDWVATPERPGRRPCVYVRVKALETNEWLEPRPSEI